MGSTNNVTFSADKVEVKKFHTMLFTMPPKKISPELYLVSSFSGGYFSTEI